MSKLDEGVKAQQAVSRTRELKTAIACAIPAALLVGSPATTKVDKALHSSYVFTVVAGDEVRKPQVLATVGR